VDEQDVGQGFFAALDGLFGEWVVAPIRTVFMFDLAFWDNGTAGEIELPLVVVWLALGALFFTLRFQFVNFRAFRHALDCVRGRYSRPDDPGEITHFQALSAALSATVGLGNIAGVAFAVAMGGPGAVFWMVLAGILGMSSKFAECTLGQKYRIVRADGHVSGGPMHYLRTGQSYAQVSYVLPFLQGWLGAAAFGGVLCFFVGLVIIGGIKRIGEVAGVLVPVMCIVYVACGLLILAVNSGELGRAFATILREALSPGAAAGGFVGVMVQGFRRAAFSNEAGIGSAPIAHSAASTPEPVREGVVALLEPFIDTVIVCTMTGLVIVVTRSYVGVHPDEAGINLTSDAFATVFPWFPAVLAITAVLFAFSTMISWSYYGEQCWVQLFGLRSIYVYKLVFLVFAFLGAMFEPGSVLDFGDYMILGMAFPNILGVVLLSGKVKVVLDDYMARLESGEITPTSS
jgi:AGCS family alanine or glycine:cation symporter